MSQFLGNVSNPNYYEGTFGPYGPMISYNKIQSLISSQLQSGFSPDLNKDHVVSDPATWDATERVYAFGLAQPPDAAFVQATMTAMPETLKSTLESHSHNVRFI